MLVEIDRLRENNKKYFLKVNKVQVAHNIFVFVRDKWFRKLPNLIDLTSLSMIHSEIEIFDSEILNSSLTLV